MRRKARRLTTSILSSSSELWLSVHMKAADGLRRQTNVIYNMISWQRPKQAGDFLKSALSCYRQNRIDDALSALEAGLKLDPGSERLLATHLRICCEQDRLARVLDFINPTKKQLCETLAGIEILDSSPDHRAIEHGCEPGPIWLNEDIISKNFDGQVFKLWCLADLLEHAGKTDIARQIHHKLSCRPTHDHDDYLYGGVSDMRLGNIEAGFQKIRLGIAAYPESEIIKSVYQDCCYSQLAFDHYLRLDSISGQEREEITRSGLSFYRRAFELNLPQAFLVKFNDARLNCNADDFRVLKDEFLEQLRNNRPTSEDAKSYIFLCRLLGIEIDFADRIFSHLYSLDWGKDDSKIKYVLNLLYKLTLPIVPRSDSNPEDLINKFIIEAQALAKNPIILSEPISDCGKYWGFWTSLFCIVHPTLYHHAISAYETLAFKLWPRLDYTAPHIDRPLAPVGMSSRKIRIGFTVLDSMPMMSKLMQLLDKDMFETVYLRPGPHGKSKAADEWVARAGTTVEYSETDAYSAIETIANQELDILISGPCVPQIFYPLMARLAHLHMVLLEPNWPDGIQNSDYYISWQLAEPENYKDFYKTPVSLLRTPPYWIERPPLGEASGISDEASKEIRHRLLGFGPTDRFYICANTPPKIHPLMDEILRKLLEKDPAGTLVFLRGEHSPAVILKARLREKLGGCSNRVIFVNTLEQNDAHSFLLSADCCIDSYPICGMSSSFDGIMLGVPIVTLPADIPFGRWTAAIYEYLGVSGLTARDSDDYVDIAIRLATDKKWRLEKSAELREKSSLYVESMQNFDEFQHFIVQAWRRKQAGLPPASWVAGDWQ